MIIKIFLCVIIFILLVLLIIKIIKIIIKHKYKIHSKNGIQKTEYITIGGIEQYIQIRGENISNPIIIMLHGGPGNNMAYYSYCWQTKLEKEYTIVHWDQRGCGNTYYHNKTAEKPTLELLLSDLDELVNYICLKYKKEKVIIIGHSWGTFLGGIYSGKHPEKLEAYIGISQMIDFKKSEEVSAQEAIRLAKRKNKNQDIEEIKEKLKLIMTYKSFDKSTATQFLKFRQLKDKYLPSGETMSLMKTMAVRFVSPYMTFNDFKWMFNFPAMMESNSKLYDLLLSGDKLSMYNYDMKYKIPVVIIAGNCDWITPHIMAFDYYTNITALKKDFVTIENVGHVPFVDRPEEFSVVLLKVLKNVFYKQNK